MIGSPNRLLRNRHVSPGQVRMLQTLWGTRLRRAGRRLRPERSREERLEHIAEIVGHAVTSSKDLSWREANRVIHRLLEEVRADGLSPSGGLPAAPEAEGSPAEVSATASSGGPPPDLSSRAVASEEGSGPQAPLSQGVGGQGGASEAQIWKIRQIEQYLGWGRPGKNEERLDGFLRAKLHVDRPEELTADQAWRAIEALCAAGARERIKARKGRAYAVKRAELTREVAALKQELQESPARSRQRAGAENWRIAQS